MLNRRMSFRAISRETGKSLTAVRYWVRKHGLRGKAYGVIGQLSSEELSRVVKKSQTLSGCLRALGLPASGNSFNVLKAKIALAECDTSHFVKYGRVKGSPNIGISREDFEKLLVSGSAVSQNQLRKYVRRYALLPYKCSKCGCEAEWLGECLVLQLDHINGKRNDNRISNLRWLCPNCHSQTATFGKKNGRTKQV